MTAVVLPARMTSPDYAGVVSRTVAFFVDATVVIVATITAAAGAQLVVTVVGAEWRDLVHKALPALVAVVPLLFALYDFVFWVLAGRTPGMALLGLRLTSTAGRRAGWLSALVRALVLTIFPIGWLWCLVDRRHQAVHDKLARTLVVRTASPVG
jgi:uncharacterized RDD family membrane protein YckC